MTKGGEDRMTSPDLEKRVERALLEELSPEEKALLEKGLQGSPELLAKWRGLEKIACLARLRVLKKRAAQSHTSRRTPESTRMCAASVRDSAMSHVLVFVSHNLIHVQGRLPATMQAYLRAHAPMDGPDHEILSVPARGRIRFRREPPRIVRASSLRVPARCVHANWRRNSTR